MKAVVLGNIIILTIVCILMFLAVVVTSSFIARRMQINVAVVIVIGILFWPAWLIMLLIAAGKDESTIPSQVTIIPVSGMVSTEKASDLPSFSHSVYARNLVPQQP